MRSVVYGIRAIRPYCARRCDYGILFQGRPGAVDKNIRPDASQVPCGTKRHRGIDALRRLIGPRSLRPIKWHFLPVHRKEVLTKKLTQVLEKISEPADHRKVAADRMARLGNIYKVQNHDNQNPGHDAEHDDVLEKIQNPTHEIHCRFSLFEILLASI